MASMSGFEPMTPGLGVLKAMFTLVSIGIKKTSKYALFEAEAEDSYLSSVSSCIIKKQVICWQNVCKVLPTRLNCNLKFTGGFLMKVENEITKNDIQNKTVYTVNEITELLNISKRTAYKLIETNEFKCVRIGRAIRVSKKSFDEWLNKNV